LEKERGSPKQSFIVVEQHSTTYANGQFKNDFRLLQMKEIWIYMILDGVATLLKMFTYSVYAALFHRPAPCSGARSEVLKPLLVTITNQEMTQIM
jgi:hypothetical protein